MFLSLIMSCSASGLTPFLSVYGYQLPLFPDLEPELEVPLALSLIRWWCRMLSETHRHFCWRAPLIPDCSSRLMLLLAPISQPGQMVWPSTQGLPLWTEFHFSVTCFIVMSNSALVPDICTVLVFPNTVIVCPALMRFTCVPSSRPPLCMNSVCSLSSPVLLWFF